MKPLAIKNNRIENHAAAQYSAVETFATPVHVDASWHKPSAQAHLYYTGTTCHISFPAGQCVLPHYIN